LKGDFIGLHKVLFTLRQKVRQNIFYIVISAVKSVTFWTKITRKFLSQNPSTFCTQSYSTKHYR